MSIPIGQSVDEPGWKQTGGMMAWTDLQKSDFFSWFSMHEVGRKSLPDGWTLVELKPGGHQEAIELTVQLDGAQSVRMATLIVDRFWMDGGQTAKLADDLVQSFLLVLARRHPEGAALARAIFEQDRGSQPFIMAAPTNSPPSAPPSESVLAGLSAYRGEEDVVELVGPDITIVLDNWRTMILLMENQEEAPLDKRLVVEVVAAVAPRRRVNRAEKQIVSTGGASAVSTVLPTPPPPAPLPPPQPYQRPRPTYQPMNSAPPPYQPPLPPFPPTPPSAFPALAPDAPPPVRPYDNLYLQASDLPPGMIMTQESRGRGADPGDTAFYQHGGIDSGMAVWHGSQSAPIFRLVDIRWVFPTAAAAAAYHHQTMGANSEGASEVPNAPKVGTDCRVFGGKFEPLGPGTGMTSYFSLFTVGRVVVKLFAADYDGRQMRPELLTPIAQNLARRVSVALGESVIPAKKPWWKLW